MKTIRNIAITVLSFTAISCGKEVNSGPKSSDNYVGTWIGSCFEDEGGTSLDSIVTISDSTVTFTQTNYSAERCFSNDKAVSTVATLDAKFGEKNSLGHNFDFKLKKMETTLLTQSAVDSENSSEEAEYTDWQVNVTRVELPVGATANYSIVGLNDSELCLGVSSIDETTDGSSQAKRHVTLDTSCFKKR